MVGRKPRLRRLCKDTASGDAPLKPPSTPSPLRARRPVAFALPRRRLRRFHTACPGGVLRFPHRTPRSTADIMSLPPPITITRLDLQRLEKLLDSLERPRPHCRGTGARAGARRGGRSRRGAAGWGDDELHRPLPRGSQRQGISRPDPGLTPTRRVPKVRCRCSPRWAAPCSACRWGRPSTGRCPAARASADPAGRRLPAGGGRRGALSAAPQAQRKQPATGKPARAVCVPATATGPCPRWPPCGGRQAGCRMVSTVRSCSVASRPRLVR